MSTDGAQIEVTPDVRSTGQGTAILIIAQSRPCPLSLHTLPYSILSLHLAHVSDLGVPSWTITLILADLPFSRQNRF
jgi:hypothetical protein